MPFDDEDTPEAQLPAALEAQASEDAPTAEETMEEEAQDFQLFASLINKKNISSKSIRKGEKDFEEHGTKLQANALEQSRQVMEEVLSFTRVHKKTNWLRGWYFPDRWADAVELEEAEVPQSQSHGEPQEAAAKRRGVDVRDRVVIIEHERGHFKTMGRIVTGQGKDKPGWDKIWLLPEEALFLLERGSLDLWWPTRPLGDIFAAKHDSEEIEKADQLGDEEDEYDLGVPLSLEAAYSLLIGNDKDRGKVTLQAFQVYSNLSRAGYRILRAPSLPTQFPPVKQPLWHWLFSLLSSGKEPRHSVLGPLVHPGLYRSYKSIYKQLAIIPRHKPSQGSPSQWEVQEPFRIHYHVWKAGTSPWSKTRPPRPDFYLAVVDTRETSVPTLEEISALLDSSPWDPPQSKWDRPGQIYPRLKWGWRNVLVAVVDHGIVNFVRIGEGAFGEEPLYPRFDSSGGPRGGKRGGRNQRNGRGGGRGRGGRGRGRGR